MIPDADHHIYMDNPDHLAKAILWDCFKEEADLVQVHDENGMDDVILIE